MAIFYDEFLGERIADTLCATTLDLSVNTARIDHFPGIVNGDKPFHCDLAGLEVNQYLRNLGAKLKNFLTVTVADLGHVHRIFKMVQALGMQRVPPIAGTLRQVSHGNLMRLAIHLQPASFEIQPVLADFRFPGRQTQQRIANRVRRFQHSIT